jgi:flavin reductase (DIM6/NTAB) family NADH-FMN oxidoreductase RutF
MTAEPCTRPHPGTSEEVTSDAFRSIFRQHPAGVAVVALRDADRPVGFTATSVISVSAEPALLTFSIAGTSSSWPALERAGSVTISFLAAEQVDVSARFATRGVDRFADVAWRWLPTGEPVLDDVPAWIRGEVVERIAVGASHLVVVHARESSRGRPAAPLVYHDRAYHSLDGSSAL